MKLDRNEIETSTPEELASRYTASELFRRMNDFAPDNFSNFIGSSSYTDLSGEILDQKTLGEYEQLLVEWFDEKDEERPIDPEYLAIAFHLWAASCFAEDKENE